MEKTRRNLLIILSIPFVIAFISWCLWFFQHRIKINVLIIDKTSITQKCNEHRSFNWVLTHLRFVKEDNTIYQKNKDYMGFFPGERPDYKIHDLDHYSPMQLDSIANALNMVYYADTYGVYYNEWYRDTLLTEHSRKVYGGLTTNDLALLQRMKARKKLVVTEFNFLASPTPNATRIQAERMMGIKWSGWVGRFYRSLDTAHNSELPSWAIRLYESQYQKHWSFKRRGIILVNENDRIVILEDQNELKKPVPYITTNDSLSKEYLVTKKVHYPFWFDITYVRSDSNMVMSYFNLYPTKRGDSLLKANDIPTRFPAIIKHRYDNLFYYFCADFADNPIPSRFTYFKGVRQLSFMLYNRSDLTDRMMFFWEFYVPLMENVLKDYNWKAF